MSKFKFSTLTSTVVALPVAMISGIGGAAVGVLGGATNSLMMPLILIGGGGLIALMIMKKHDR
jgi:large-conductance mechanosensitive channel